MISPTIGRVVLFHNGINHQSDQTYPAFVTYVWNDRLINVAWFNANGSPGASTSVRLLQDEDPVPVDGGPYAQWMPYQKQQAEKHGS